MKSLVRYDTVSIILLLLLLVSACSPPQRSSSEGGSPPVVAPARGGTLTYRLPSAPSTFNYLVASDEPSVVMSFFLLGARLVDFDHRSRSYVPALAESWRVGEDGRTVDIKLRDGLKFSDGAPLTTEDVSFTLAAIYDERSNSPAYRDSLMIGDKTIEIRTLDMLTIQLVFPVQVASVETYLTNFAILPSHVLKSKMESGELAGVWTIDADPKSIVTSGPFTVESALPGSSVTLARNPNYWKKDLAGNPLPYLDKLVLKVVDDPNAALSGLLQSELDIVDRIRPSDYASLTSTPGMVKAVDLGPGMATDYIWFNLNKSKRSGERLDDKPKYRWFSDKRFRRAIAHAVDRDSIARNALRGLATPLYGFVSPASRDWINENILKPHYDLERSRQLLMEGGFVSKTNGTAVELFDPAGNRVEFSLILPAGNEPRMLMAGVIQQDLAKLGIALHVVPVESPALSERWAKSFDYDAVLLGLAVTDFEPSSFANFLLSSGAVHQWQPLQKEPATDWEARIDHLFSQQASERDQKKRAALFAEIQSLLADELPIIPVVARHVVAAAHERVGNHAPSTIMPNSLWNSDQLFVKQ